MTEDKRNTEKYKEVVAQDYTTTVSGAGDSTDPLNEGQSVVIQPPELEAEEPEFNIVQEEVSYKDLVQPDPQVQDVGEKVDYTAELNNMVGSSLDVVEAYLNELKTTNVISEYVLMPMGALGSLDHVDGRVRVHYDLEKKVLGIEIG